VTALVQSVADDMADAGLAVTMGSTAPLIRDSRPVALAAQSATFSITRSHNKTARVDVRATPAAIEIVIDDDGPGIRRRTWRVCSSRSPVEGSRNQETGGVGLGLAIARSIVEAHGGTLTLANRPEGGLRVMLTLPK
jgi:signal transduction histidine kinase